MRPSAGGHRRGHVGQDLVLGAALLTLAGATPAAAQSSASEPEVPEAMARLGALEGTWRADRVEFLGEDGQVRSTSSAETRNRVYLDGLAFHHEGRLAEPDIRTQAWYYWEPEEERLYLAAVSSGGQYDEFVGGWQGDRLVMVTEPREHYRGRLFRVTIRDIREDSFTEHLEVSTDGGETWRMSHRQVMQRVDPRGSGSP